MAHWLPAWRRIAVCLFCCVCCGGIAGTATGQRAGSTSPPRWLDLTRATVLLSPSAGPVERKAAQMLIEEAEKRSGVTLHLATRAPMPGTPTIYLSATDHLPKGQAKPPMQGVRFPLLTKEGAGGGRSAPEGFLLKIFRNGRAPAVVAQGNDARGCLFAAGRLLRAMRFSPGKIEAPALNLASAPALPLRGHQIGWRPKSNTYDRWGLKEYEQYLRDLIVWGTNAIELIPFDPDDDPQKGLEMTVRLADLIASYGLQVWLWFPIDDRTHAGLTGAGLTPGKTPCPSEADGRRFLLDRRRELFRRIKHLDAVFIPGGDPGGCPCDKCTPWVHTMLPLAEEIASILRETHPRAQMWLSNQGFSAADNRAFYATLAQRPRWLTGVVYAPWAEESFAEMRAQTPQIYPIRQYPDITHAVRCQYPARDWDPAFALTLGREPPLYRPTDHAQIARLYRKSSLGAITYSDGVNDDLNKVLWSALLWNPDENLRTLLTDYGRYYLGEKVGAQAAEGILALEKNGQGPIERNPQIEITYRLWDRMEQDAPKTLRQNWRFQMGLLRACYDLYVARKRSADVACETETLALLAKAKDAAPVQAVAQALERLKQYESVVVEPQLRARLLKLGQALYDSIGMQLSVPRWGASGGERGAILDYLDAPLANQAWLRAELTKLQSLHEEETIREGIARILNWENPGPGGFYDDLGHPGKQPHLVRQKRWADDPGYVDSARTDFTGPYPDGRQSWNDYAETLYGTPLLMRYTGLDPNAAYTLRATYSGRYRPTLQLIANDKYPIHGPRPTSIPPLPQEWPVPREATRGGTLTLRWDRLTGRGAQVSEVWLIKNPPASK